ncbi:MAG TPA: gliding motility-associated C-terminal domain-containing protein, partial [Saprospiraceae bacterium]|nr:gliding motility-associated C-terminal domain-containing protein [Saprospiraceae bacterium]
GCDSMITHQIIYSPIDTTEQLTYTCDPDEAGLLEEWLTTQDGCDSLVQTFVQYEPASVSIQVLSDFNGYELSCDGSNDGVLKVLFTGITPFEIQWSTSDTSVIISNISAGHYEVTVTDGNGCSSISGVEVDEPPLLQLTFIVSHPDCFTNNSGNITAVASGGVLPYQYSLDGIDFQSSSTFQNLSNGLYELVITDANQCSAIETILINQPVPVDVDLGSDAIILPGESVELNAIVNLSADQLAQINWYGVDTSECADCLTQIVAPFITTSYAIEILTNEGCADSDTVTLVVVSRPDLYIPNIFSPNNNGINDHFRIYAGKNVQRISSLVIFDRWGGVMFAVEDLSPDDPSHYWDGQSNGKPCAPGVYVYQLVAVLANRETIVRVGNVTLVR